MKIKKKNMIIAATAAMLILGAGCVAVLMRSEQSETALKENQSYLYAYVMDITGNEITYSVLDESVVTAYLEQQEEAEESDKSSAGGTPDMGEMPDMEEMSDDERPDMGEIPDMPDMNEMESRSGMPDRSEMEVRGDMPDRSETSDMDDVLASNSDGEGRKNAQTITTLIPVGVTVHTQSDDETTFQRLVSGDMIKLLVETTDEGEEVITEIWML